MYVMKCMGSLDEEVEIAIQGLREDQCQSTAQPFLTMEDPPHSGPKQHSQHPSPAPSTCVPIHTDPPSLPPIHLRLHPITHPGAKAFSAAVPDIGDVLENAVHNCWKILYNNEEHLFPRSIRSITVYVRPMGGVAYTTGNWLDGENKEIHLSAEYVEGQSKERVRDEILGVLVHEMVHVWQNNGAAPWVPTVFVHLWNAWLIRRFWDGSRGID